MNIPKPSEIKRPAPKKEQAKDEKPKYVRKPHLTQKPFRNSEIISLRDGLRKGVKIKKG